FGVQRIGDLAALPEATLQRRFGQHGGELAQRAQGIDPSRVVPSQAPKSIGHEHTFEGDVVDAPKLEATLLDLAESVATRLRRHHMAAGAVQLKLGYEGFETLTRQDLLRHETGDGETLSLAGI